MRNLSEKAKINETFPEEHVLATSHFLIPWFADFAQFYY